jgi:hypothetical protein
LLDLDHGVTLVEGRPHVQNHSPSLQASGSMVVRDVYPVHAAIKGQLLKHSSHYLHWIRLRGKAQVGSQLLHSTKKERGRMATILSWAARSLRVGPPFLEGIPLREYPRVAIIEVGELL